MTKVYLLSTVAVVLTCSSAFAGETVQLHRSKTPLSLPKQYAQEVPLNPTLAANAAFGAAIEDALIQPGGRTVTDPSRRFAVQVGTDNGGRTIRLIGQSANDTREWRLGSGSGDQVIAATISEIMSAVGQPEAPTIASAGRISDRTTK